MLCGSTMGMVGCAGETEWAIEKPSIPPYFRLSAHFSRIIDGSRDVQLSGMKMSQSPGSGGRDRSLGQRGEEYMPQLLCSTNAEEWAWAGNVTAVNMLSLGGLLLRNGIWFVYHPSSGTVFQPFLPAYMHPPPTPPPHWPPGERKNGWTPKINPLPQRKLIYGGPLMKADNSSNIFMLRGCSQLHVPHSRDHGQRWHPHKMAAATILQHHYFEMGCLFSLSYEKKKKEIQLLNNRSDIDKCSLRNWA